MPSSSPIAVSVALFAKNHPRDFDKDVKKAINTAKLIKSHMSVVFFVIWYIFIVYKKAIKNIKAATARMPLISVLFEIMAAKSGI